MLRTIIIFLFYSITVVGGTNIDSALAALRKLPAEMQKQNYQHLLLQISLASPIEELRDLQALTAKTNKPATIWFYIRALYPQARFLPGAEEWALYRKAYRMADSLNFSDLQGRILILTARKYKSELKFDSAMTDILRATDLLQESGDRAEYVTALEELANMYFNAALLDKAEAAYKRIYELKGDSLDWRYWRKVVIQNNLGLIELERKNYGSARNYFLKSLEFKLAEAARSGMSHFDVTQSAYIYAMLAQIELADGNPTGCYTYLQQTENLCKKIKTIPEHVRLHAGYGDYYAAAGKYDKAIAHFKLGLEFVAKEPMPLAEIRLYAGLMHCYAQLKDYRNYYLVNEQYIAKKNKAEEGASSGRYLQIVAENNYRRYKENVNRYETERRLLLTIVVTATVAVIILVLLFLRLRKQNKRLIQRSIDMYILENTHKLHSLSDSFAMDIVHVEHDAEHNDLENVNEADEQGGPELNPELAQTILSRLSELMESQKLYLNPDISLGDLAEMLSTNRTYLSRVINVSYKKNFNGYLNLMRVNEAILLIINGYGETLNLEGLSRKCGFNSRSSFARAFEKYTGVTPSYFLRNYKKL